MQPQPLHGWGMGEVDRDVLLELVSVDEPLLVGLAGEVWKAAFTVRM